MSSKIYDVLIIGGGPAGLSMALPLARQDHSALIIDSGVYRNARATHMHMVLGFDHADPADFRAKVRDDLAKRYDCIEFASETTIETVRKLDSGLFEAVDTKGAVYQGKKLGLATGVRDILEEMPEGFDECFGYGIFHCLFCHGFEERGAESVGVFAAGLVKSPQILQHVTLMAKRLAKSVTVYTNGDETLAAAGRSAMHSTKIRYDNRPVARFRLVDGGPRVTIEFADGSAPVTEGWVSSHPNVEQRAPFAAQLGLELQPSGDIKTSPPFNETSLPGCFAGGDAATMMKNAMQAMNMGGFASAGMVAQLQHELDEKDEL